MKEQNSGHHPWRTMPSLAVAFAMTAGFMSGSASGSVLVNLDATKLPVGELSTWANKGTVAGDFISSGSITPAVVEKDTVKGVEFLAVPTDGNGGFYTGPGCPQVGNASRTIEAWIWDPAGQDEKTIVAWGRRGGSPDGSNCAFNHGVNATYGAMGQWGSGPDMGWSNNIVFQRWTYIVYTYDTATARGSVYKDGVLASTEIISPALNTYDVDSNGAGLPIRIARQNDASGIESTSGAGPFIAGRIRIQDAVMTEAAILAKFEQEKNDFALGDGDGDGIADWFESRYSFLNKNDAADAAKDQDNDGLSNLQEFGKGTDPTNPDTDGDGLKDGVETGTGVWGGAANTGTDPLKADTDGDGLKDGAETNTGKYVGPSDTGSNPLKTDTDGDSFDDYGEMLAGSDPDNAKSMPSVGNWTQEVGKSKPKYWWRFEETDPTMPAKNDGSVEGYDGAYGEGILASAMGKTSVVPALGKALEFTGPAANKASTKNVDLTGSSSPVDVNDISTYIPELTNFRNSSQPMSNKVTSVEYWIKTTVKGTHGGNSWQSPAILSHESPGDGDMYWGYVNGNGEFLFSTSDNNECNAKSGGSKNVADGQWHHIAMVKYWDGASASRSQLYIDGGPEEKGALVDKTIAGGNNSYQDTDSAIRFLGVDDNGELENVQFIGTIDELAIYDRALTASEVRLHFRSVAHGDTDADGMPDAWEINNGLNPDVADASQDPDNDGLTNIQEYLKGTDPKNPDTDGDGLKDGVETGTGVFVSASDTGTDPWNADMDNDGLKDGIETSTGKYVSASNTGTNPFKKDSDGDGYSDSDEVAMGFNPTDAASKPTASKDYKTAVLADKPAYYWRFEETTTAEGVKNEGSVADFNGVYGDGILNADLGKPSAASGLGKAIEFTGPTAPNSTTKFVDFGANIPELVNLRDVADTPMEEGKATTVEYWFMTTIRGSNGNNTWQNPSILAHESGGDGDMYWGNFNSDGDFIFSTSDMHDAHITNGYATDGKWHHVVMTKIWHTNSPCISRLYMDGGALAGGKTIETTTPAGNTSGQDSDCLYQYLGLTHNGELSSVQYIGQLDEVAIYPKAFNETMARLHYAASGLIKTPIQFSIKGITVVAGTGNPTITWEAVSGTTYIIQRTDSLSSANWTQAGQVVASDVTASYADTSRPAEAKVLFYRVQIKP